MKILIVYRDEPLFAALDQQLRQRGHAVLGVAVAVLPDFLRQLTDEECVVVDAASRDLDAIGRSALDAALFHALLAQGAQHRWPLLLLSDSRVFPAGSKQRYREIDPAQPNTAPGTALAEREAQLAQALRQHLIVRSGPLIDAAGANLLTGQLARLRANGVLAAASGARFCPTPAADLARVIAAICDQVDCNAQCWGIYHYHSSDPTTGYEFAEVLLAAATQYWALEPGRVEQQIAVDDPLASLYPLLSCQRIRDTFGIQQLPWRKAIPQLLKTIYAGESS